MSARRYVVGNDERDNLPAMQYEARCNFSHPGLVGRFRAGEVYEIDDALADVLAAPIEHGKLVPVPPSPWVPPPFVRGLDLDPDDEIPA